MRPTEWLEQIPDNWHNEPIPHAATPPAESVCDTCSRPWYDSDLKRWSCECKRIRKGQIPKGRFYGYNMEPLSSSANTTPAGSTQASPENSPAREDSPEPEPGGSRETGVRPGERQKAERLSPQQRKRIKSQAALRNRAKERRKGLDGPLWSTESTRKPPPIRDRGDIPEEEDPHMYRGPEERPSSDSSYESTGSDHRGWMQTGRENPAAAPRAKKKKRSEERSARAKLQEQRPSGEGNSRGGFARKK